MTSRLRPTTFLLLLLAVSARPDEPRPGIVFSCWVPPDVPIYQRLEDLYRNAFNALGYDFEMHYRPNQRSLMEASAGITDGECARTDSYGRENPESNLVRVDTQIAETTLEAWSHDADLQLSRVEELGTQTFRIGYVRGHVAVGAIMAQYPNLPLTSVTSTKHGLKMVSVGRLDLFIGTSISTRQRLDSLQLPHPIYSAGHLMVLRGHPYLHQRHQHMADAFASELEKRLPEGGWQFD